ncbi:serine/threonine-protein kinase [Geothrix sp. 21YS21S-4]|uniref:serine/threonine-protein kinase n=1 Tax=Geothrix sp. 21YS21S-4 TaxID=3068889 RepID=UPI0027BAF4E1|nr:serine/threonine-protein kinase [Geothrix sp. 21YS21S-4]
MLTHLGKFEIVQLLAQGSMGEVYVGRDPILNREVAIKVIHPSASVGAAARERFATEARAAGALNHPNIVTIHEMGEDQGVLYLAMELVKGEDLGTLIRAGTLSPRDTLEVLAQVCDGLAVAHRQKVLHRDLKPSNLRVVWDGTLLQAKILDFGVAKILNSDTTDEGTVFGTVNYMAPEYLQSGRPDSRSDLFAVGVILYEALAGLPPFDGPSPGSVIYRLLHATPPPLPPTAYRGISREVQGILNRALAKDPAQRFQTAEELASALRRAKDPLWRWNQERPTTALPLHPAPSAARTALPTPPKGLPLAALRPAAAVPPVSPSSSPVPAKGDPKAEVRRDVLETTRLQLLQAIDLDPRNVRAHALLLVTLYRLGRLDAMMQTFRHARDRGISSSALRAIPRCAQLAEEEERACRLPLDQHQEFLAFLRSAE